MPVTELSALTHRQGHQLPDLQVLRRADGRTGLTPLWKACAGSKRKRCVPSPLTHRTPRRWRAPGRWRWSQRHRDKTEPMP